MTTRAAAPEDDVVTARTYELTIAGESGRTMAAAFDDFEVIPGDGRTILRVQLEDQAALHGAIARLRALGLELLEVRSYGQPGPVNPAGGGRGTDGVAT
jgi:hypothetical protein